MSIQTGISLAGSPAGPSPQPEGWLRRGFVRVSHDLILDRNVNDRAMLLWVVLADLQGAGDQPVRRSQPDLARRCGWRTGRRLLDSAERLVRRATRTLEEGEWITTQTRGGGRYTLTSHRVASIADDAAFEMLPRHVLDTFTRQEDGAQLLHTWLRLRHDANAGTNRGFTTRRVASFAYTYGLKTDRATRHITRLEDLGLVKLTRDDEGAVTCLRFVDMMVVPDQASDGRDAATGQSVPFELSGELAEASAMDLPNRPTVFRPLPDHAENHHSGAGSSEHVVTVRPAADEPPIINVESAEDLTVQAQWAARQIMIRCPQLQGLGRVTQRRIERGIAKAWRRWSDRPVQETIDAVLVDLALAEDDGRLHRNHIVLIKQVLRRWDADRLVRPTQTAPAAVTAPRGMTLEDLAATTIPQVADGDVEAACRALTIRAARSVLDDLCADGTLDDAAVERALRKARRQLGTELPASQMTLWAIAAAKVRSAHHVSLHFAAQEPLADDATADPVVQQMILDSLAQARALSTAA